MVMLVINQNEDWFYEKRKIRHCDFQDAVRSARIESGASVEFQLESPATAERIR